MLGDEDGGDLVGGAAEEALGEVLGDRGCLGGLTKKE